MKTKLSWYTQKFICNNNLPSKELLQFQFPSFLIKERLQEKF